MDLIQKFIRRTNIFLERHQYEDVTLNGKVFRLSKGYLKADYDNAWFYALAKKSSNLMDIGSNIGAQTLLAFAAGNLQTSFLVDANANALAIAAKNLIHNNLVHKARFYAAFVSDEDNTNVKFWTVGAGAAGSMYESHAKTAHKQSSYYTVRTVTVDHIVNSYSLRPDLIKIDVEGAEAKVLQGSSGTADKFKPVYFVEMHSNAELAMEQNASSVLQWCSLVRYKAYYLKDHVVLDDPATIKHRGRCHLLLLPSEMPYPQSLKLIKQGDIVV